MEYKLSRVRVLIMSSVCFSIMSRGRVVFSVYFIFFTLVRLSIDAIFVDKQNCLFTPFAAFLKFSTVKMMIVNAIMDTQKIHSIQAHHVLAYIIVD